MVGWGVDNSTGTPTPYWRCQNSWGTTWGEGGFFRILRGADECDIESIPAAGTPVLNATGSGAAIAATGAGTRLRAALRLRL